MRDDEYDFSEEELYLDEDIFSSSIVEVDDTEYSIPTFDCSDKAVLGDSGSTMYDMMEKTKAIFEKVVGLPLTIQVDQHSETYIYNDTSDVKNMSYTMVVGEESQNDIPMYTRFNHELSHYAFDSLSQPISTYFHSELQQIPTDHVDKALEMYKHVYNVIEDHRVESCMSKIYLGVGKRFVEARKTIGSSLNVADNPIKALGCARNFREELIPENNPYAVKCLKQVELKDKIGGILATKEYINKVVNPWLLNNLYDPNTKESKNNSSLAEEAKKPHNKDMNLLANQPMRNQFKESYEQNRICDHRDHSSSQSTNGEATDDPDNIQNMYEEWQKSDQSADGHSTMANSELKAKETIQKFKDEIERQARKSIVAEHPDTCKITKQINVSPYAREKYNIDNAIASSLNRLFKLLQKKHKNRLSDVGSSLNMSAYVQRLAKGYGDVFNDERPSTKTAITIGIDVSGSMTHRIHVARDMLATLFKSLENVRGVDLEAFTWSGGEDNCGVMSIKSLRDCELATMYHSLGGTPTNLALLHGYNILSNKNAKNKLFILMTDESPHGIYMDDMNKYMKNMRKKHRINTMGIGFGCNNYGFEEYFGRGNYLVLGDIETAKDEVIKTFKTTIINTLRGKL